MIEARSPALQCPQDRFPLRTLRHGEVAVDYCAECGGIWFDGGELERVLGTGVRLSEHLDGRPSRSSSRTCPNGHGPMRLHTATADRRVVADACPACHGVWVDRGELRRVHARSPARDPIAEERVEALEARVEDAQAQWAESGVEHREREARSGPREWWFQFILHLPQEVYNPVRIKPWVTYALIAVNVLVFLLQLASADHLIPQGALVPAAFLRLVAPWTIITAMFLHGNLLHLLGNMYFLWIFGDNAEERLGRVNYLALYLIGGLFAFFAQILSDPASTEPMVGASGAVSAVLGAYFYLFRERRIYAMILFFLVRIRTIWYLGIYLALQFFYAAVGVPGVAWWAHIGGFVTGLVWAVADRAVARRRLAMIEGVYGR